MQHRRPLLPEPRWIFFRAVRFLDRPRRRHSKISGARTLWRLWETDGTWRPPGPPFARAHLFGSRLYAWNGMQKVIATPGSQVGEAANDGIAFAALSCLGIGFIREALCPYRSDAHCTNGQTFASHRVDRLVDARADQRADIVRPGYPRQPLIKNASGDPLGHMQ
jgi:hypothetical protein